MPKNILKFGNIVKRSNYLNSANAKHNSDINMDSIREKCDKILAQLESVKTREEYNKKNISSSINSVLRELYNTTCADEFKEFPLRLIEKFNNIDTSISSYILNEYVNNVIPYMSNFSYINETLNRYNLNNTQKTLILDEASLFTAADRILENHKTISKRFNIENEILKTNGKGLKYVSETCANMIDTYNLKSYQKLNLCIEEMSYLLDKNNIRYNKSDLVEYVTEYFLLGSKVNNKALNNYKKALTESCILSENDLSSVKYLFETEDNCIASNDSICAAIHNYLIDPEKDIKLLTQILDSCTNTDTIDLSYNLDKLLYFILDVYKSDLQDESELDKAMTEFVKKFNNRIDEIFDSCDESINQEFVDSLLNTLVDFITFVPNTDERVNTCITFIKQILEKVNSYSGIPYTKYNLKTIKEINSCNEAVLFEANKIFKHHNLLRAMHNLDKYLGQKCQDALSKAKDKTSELKNKVDKILYPEPNSKLLNKVKDVQKKYYDALGKGIKSIFIKEDNNELDPYSYIGSDQKFDIILGNIPVDESSEDLVYLNQYLSYLCEGFNNSLNYNGYDSLRCYYLISGCNAEVHLKEMHSIIMNDDQLALWESAVKHDFDYPISKLSESINAIQYMNTIDNKDIENSLFTYFSKGNSMDIEKFDTVLEALSVLGIDYDTAKLFGEKYLENQYLSLSENAEYLTEEVKVNRILSEYREETDIPLEGQLEAYLIFGALMESRYEDDDDDDYDVESFKSHRDADDIKKAKDKALEKDDKDEDDEDDENQDVSPEELAEIRKNPYKGINLKPMKLYLMGLKSKFKGMDTKQKEVSKNLDVNFKHLISSFRDALISNRREAIIKGSVIPSFSKCIKGALGLAGSYVISGFNPAVPAIIALGGFAVSKHLTKKERILLLDEIETELEVVEKEIQLADREDDMKKLKALLTYKKNLQRQYQRIRYNVKNKGNLLPNSSAGLSSEYD